MIDLLLNILAKLKGGYDIVRNPLIEDNRVFTKECPTLEVKRQAAIKALGDNYILKGGSWSRNPKILSQKA